jgi:hypothetical protein
MILMYREDTKLIDLLAALSAGLMLQYQSWSSVAPLLIDPSIFTAYNLKHGSLYMAACALAALIVFLWKSGVRRKIGWALIAVLGAGFCTGIQEYLITQALAQEPMAIFAGHPFILLSFMSNCYTTLLAIGAVHYSGVLLREVIDKRHSRYQ